MPLDSLSSLSLDGKERNIGRDEVIETLTRVAKVFAEWGMCARILVGGGGALILQSNIRDGINTSDVDALLTEILMRGVPETSQGLSNNFAEPSAKAAVKIRAAAGLPPLADNEQEDLPALYTAHKKEILKTLLQELRDALGEGVLDPGYAESPDAEMVEEGKADRIDKVYVGSILTEDGRGVILEAASISHIYQRKRECTVPLEMGMPMHPETKTNAEKRYPLDKQDWSRIRAMINAEYDPRRETEWKRRDQNIGEIKLNLA